MDRLGDGAEAILRTVVQNIFDAAFAQLLRAADAGSVRSRGDVAARRFARRLLALIAAPGVAADVRCLRATDSRLGQAFADPPRALKPAVDAIVKLWAQPGGGPPSLDRLEDVRAAFAGLKGALAHSGDPERARFAASATLFFAVADYYTAAVYSLNRVARHARGPAALDVARKELEVLTAVEGHAVAVAGNVVEHMRRTRVSDGTFVRGCASIQRAVAEMQRISGALAGAIAQQP